MYVRKYKPEDQEEIYKLFYDTVHAINTNDYTQEQVDVWAPLLIGEKLGALQKNICYVAIDFGQIIGFADLTNDGLVDHLYTHKDFQGQGIASQLLVQLEKEARELGLKELRTEASIPAKPFFEHQGFHVVKTQSKVHKNVTFTNYLMVKNLQ
jgi:putative acetyltransferase